MKKYLVLLLMSFLLSSCKVGPDYHRPTLPIPLNYKESSDKHFARARLNQVVTQGPWWTVFHSKQLNQLECALNLSDQNIIAARAQYKQARFLVDEARAAYFPTLTATASVIRQSTSSGSGSGFSNGNNNGFGNNNSSNNSSITVQSLNLNATWEADIWGATRRSVEASVANAQASYAQLAAMRLSEEASLAQYYFELRGVDTDQVLLNKTVIANKKILALTKNQLQQGTASMSDVLSARSQLENSQALAINNGINRALYEHAIAVLTGRAPAEVTIRFNPLTGKPPTIPAELPSQLLERRPDIASEERLVAQANAQIGVAFAAYFPILSFSPTALLQRTGYGDWFSLPLLAWSIGPALAQTILDGGLRSATLNAARQNYQAVVAQYRQTVLVAFQNVEDNLAALRILKAQSVVANRAARDANASLNLIVNQLNAGTAAYPTVYTAQVNAYAAEKTALDITTLRMTYTVALVKALGGDWHVSELPS